MRVYQIKLAIVLVLGISPLIFVSGQVLDREVYIESTYRPEIADAEKITTMPVITDTVNLETPGDYTLLPSRISTDFSPRPIKPARMVGTPLDKLYNSQIKLGMGNYVTPLAEYSIHSLRSKDYAIGGYLFHKSSYTKLELDNGANVPAGYGKSVVSVYGKKFYDDVTLHADAGVSRHRLRHYGYNTSNFTDSVPEPEAEDIKQWFNRVYGEVGMRAARGDSASPDFSLFMRGDYLTDHYGSREPHFGIWGDMSFPAGDFRIGLDGRYDYFKLTGDENIFRESITTFRPYVLKRNKEWEVKLAGRMSIQGGDISELHFYPDLSLRFQVIEKAMITYFSLSGYLENHSYESMSRKNPYLIPGLYVMNTNHVLVAQAGLEGYFSKNASYRFDVTFDATEQMPFFLNDTNSIMQNTFGVVYDDTDVIRLHGEIVWQPFTFLQFMTGINFYDYRMVSQEHAWHRPDVDLSFTTRYNFKRKVFAEVSYLYSGKRFAKNLYPGSPVVELAPIHDLNLKLEYKYSNVLSAFVDFYNLLSQEYYLWNQYPVQRINLLAGLTYKF